MGAIIFSAVLIWLSSIAVAQQPDTVRVRGTIESTDHQLLSVRARDGEMLKIKLADNAPVRAVVKAPLSDVKKGRLRRDHRHASA
jgi:hypothetical protein